MPNRVILFNPDTEVFNRPELHRLFFAVGYTDANALDIRYLDFSAGELGWQPWSVGHVLHWHPFKVILRETSRAGLHITCEWRDGNGEMRYGSNYKVRTPGIFVINPSSVMCLVENIVDATKCRVETANINRVLASMFATQQGYRQILALPLPNGAMVDPGLFFHGA